MKPSCVCLPADCRAGDVVVRAGTRLSPAHIAVAAAMGRTSLRVTARPRIAVVTTGDELVDAEAWGADVAGTRIVNSNSPMLAAALGIVAGALIGSLLARRQERVRREIEKAEARAEASRILTSAKDDAENLRRARSHDAGLIAPAAHVDQQFIAFRQGTAAEAKITLRRCELPRRRTS